MKKRERHEGGFGLAEVLVAMGLVAVAVAGLATLVTLAVRSAVGAHDQTRATILAAQKMEQLRAVTTATVPASAGSLATDVPGYVDWLTGDGQPALGAAAIYVRRWAVGPVAGQPNVGMLQVLVSTTTRDRAAAAAGPPRVRAPDEALLVTLTGRR